jgi:hypothetical protein
MAIVTAVVGQVRAVREFTRRRDEENGQGKTGDVLGRNVSVLTELAGELGDTATVTVWDRDRAVEAAPGDWVQWVCEVGSREGFGLSTTFRRVLAPPSKTRPAEAG